MTNISDNMKKTINDFEIVANALGCLTGKPNETAAHFIAAARNAKSDYLAVLFLRAAYT